LVLFGVLADSGYNIVPFQKTQRNRPIACMANFRWGQFCSTVTKFCNVCSTMFEPGYCRKSKSGIFAAYFTEA